MCHLGSPRRFTWQGRQNAYHSVDVLAASSGPDGKTVIIARDFQQWRHQVAETSRFDPIRVDPEFVKLPKQNRATRPTLSRYGFRPGGHADRRARLGHRVGARVGELRDVPTLALDTFTRAPTIAAAER